MRKRETIIFHLREIQGESFVFESNFCDSGLFHKMKYCRLTRKTLLTDDEKRGLLAPACRNTVEYEGIARGF